MPIVSIGSGLYRDLPRESRTGRSAMSSVPNTAALPMRQPSPIPGAASALPVASIDPVKLVLKYRWWLVLALVGGLMLGVAGHFALMVGYPVWRANVWFECFMASSNIEKLQGSESVGENDLERFMTTQAKLVTSERVMRKVIEDPRLLTDAQRWCEYYRKRDGTYNTAEMILDLQDEVSSRVIPQTRLIEVAMTYRDKRDVTAVMKLVREKFLIVVGENTGQGNREQLDSVLRSINEISDQIKSLTISRDRLMSENGVDIIKQTQVPEASEQLRQINQELVRLNLDKQAFTVRLRSLEEDLRSPGGVIYSDQLRDEVETDPQMLNIKNAINQLEADRQSLSLKLTPIHRSVKEVEKQLDGYRKQLDSERERLLRQKFDAQVDGVRKAINQMDAQEAELSTKKNTSSQRLVVLSRVSTQLEDYESQIKNLTDQVVKMKVNYQNLSALISLQTAKRVTVLQEEREPSDVIFPKLKVMLPAGGVVVFGLVLGVLVLRELVDQRVKGPSDVALIPRARVIGMVPDASEDPAAPSAVETAFRDRERGVMAESFRQVRTNVLRRMQQMGHKSLLVVSGLPGSGATSVVTNLAYACAAADRRVLVIDANLRRPGLHKIFGLPDSPGLADVLAGARSLSDAVQRSADQRVDVLPAGSREARVYERLSTDAMAALLREAGDKYDLILIDTAPMVVSGDGLGMAQRCDASMLVIRALSEKRGMVARLRSELADSKAELLGVLVNGVKSSAGGYLKGNIRATHEYQTKDAA